jgi:hypothetical protein
LYRVEVHNLKTPFGTNLAHLPIIIELDADDILTNEATPGGGIGGEDYPYPTTEPEDIEDYSIKEPPFAGEADDDAEDEEEAEASDPFALVSVTPADLDSYQMDPQANGGKIVVEFNKAPAANYLNNSDFKLQRKSLTGVSSWENVNTAILAESGEPKVNIYLPSQDSIPIYSFEDLDEDDTIYWVEGYKYRLTISKYVGI